MSKKTKYIIIIALAIFVIISIPKLIFSIGLPSDNKQFSDAELNELLGGVYDRTRYSYFNSATIHLDRAFVDREIALTEIKKMLKSFIWELSIIYSLPEFNAETVGLYRKALNDYRDSHYRASKGAPIYKLNALSYFCETYLNTDNNLETIQTYGMKDEMEKTMGYFYTRISTTGFVFRKDQENIDRLALLISDLLKYMNNEFNIGRISDETIHKYIELLPNVTDEKLDYEKKLLQAFYELYINPETILIEIEY